MFYHDRRLPASGKDPLLESDAIGPKGKGGEMLRCPAAARPLGGGLLDGFSASSLSGGNLLSPGCRTVTIPPQDGLTC